ncbi:MarR family winged helix-turn-helix transcriptional regulator [Nocardiopsis exhalans]|uniref:MarR family winged helix-turn-helix transcriptional regulator n=1 Tax=Nocardiopsis exhalans TaxID=163604 RepID=A0ABY5D6R8_9ACTN|nr:MarR family winged helix-turn-helix transcriptional regulator [Nocardiopsis exhalans]USY19650.1 MarR family winged helix-turn-helix transcriptional regulator [Nocardiopsis exhalans]
MDATQQGLSPDEQNAWESFIRMQEILIGRLSRLVRSDSGMSAADYIVLAKLTEAPDSELRFLELAKLLEWEKSRMSHQVTRMVKRGLVAKKECHDDARGAFVVATPLGHKAIQDAAPMHAEHVRRLFIDALTPNQLNTFARLSHRVLEHMEKQPD